MRTEKALDLIDEHVIALCKQRGVLHIGKNVLISDTTPDAAEIGLTIRYYSTAQRALVKCETSKKRLLAARTYFAQKYVYWKEHYRKSKCKAERTTIKLYKKIVRAIDEQLKTEYNAHIIDGRNI